MKVKINVQSLIKKPTTAAEAIEKRDSAKWLGLACLAVAILLTVIAGIIQVDFLETVGYLVIVGAVVCFAIWYFARADVFKFQNAYCECGKKFVFPDNVSYEITGEQVSSGKSSNGNSVITHTNTKVSFLCKCTCGKEHTFNSSFVTDEKELNSKGVVIRTKDYPLENQIAAFFK